MHILPIFLFAQVEKKESSRCDPRLKAKKGGCYNHYEYQAHHQPTIALHRVNEIVPPNFLINWQTRGVESSCGHKDYVLSQVM